MKGYIQTCLLALAAVALGQTGLGDLPDCAKTCAANLPPECNLADIKCYCSSSSWIQTLSCCVKNSCADTDQAKTIQVASNLCQLAGVTVPTVASCAASSASSTAAAASSTAGSSVTGAQTATTASRSSASSATQISSSSASAAASATGTSSRSATSATQSATSASSAGAASASASHGAAAGHFFGQGLSAAGAAAFAFALL